MLHTRHGEQGDIIESIRITDIFKQFSLDGMDQGIGGNIHLAQRPNQAFASKKLAVRVAAIRDAIGKSE
jgi:hypothetical protein